MPSVFSRYWLPMAGMPEMRVVVCYYFASQSIPLGSEIAAAFTSLGHEVFCFDSSARESHMGLKRIAKSFAKLMGAKRRLSAYFEAHQNQRLAQDFVDFCRSAVPDLVLVIRGEGIPQDALDTVAAACRAKTAVWWVKNPRWQGKFLQEAKRFNSAFTIDESLCAQGINYLPCWSANRTVFFPLPFEQKKRGLLFIGTWSERRQHYLESLADLPLEIIGPEWDRLPLGNPLRPRVVGERVSQEEMAERYRSVWAVVDINQIEQTQGQGVNMRFADVPASGTVLLTEPSREIERWQLAEHCAQLFRSRDELRACALAVLDEAEMCRAMCEAAVEVALTMPTFVDRAQQILDVLSSHRRHQ